MSARRAQWALGAGLPEVPPDCDGVHLVLHRDDLQEGVGGVVDDLLTISDDVRLRQQLAHGISFSFGGYDDDPREIWHIPECRRFLQDVHGQWRYWLHFLAPRTDQWGPLLECLAALEEEREAQPWSGGVRRPVLERILQDMLGPLNVLHNAMDLTRDARMAIFDPSMRAILDCTPPQ